VNVRSVDLNALVASGARLRWLTAHIGKLAGTQMSLRIDDLRYWQAGLRQSGGPWQEMHFVQCGDPDHLLRIGQAMDTFKQGSE
jgi:hypothetical protein